MKHLPAGLLLVVLGVFVWSAIRPHDYGTWAAEVLPVIVVVPLLIATRDRFPLTPLLYGLIAVHACILMVGAHYTYAQVPLGDLMRDVLGTARNPYDRLGHLAQGFVPAIAIRELLLRTSPLGRGGWLASLVVFSCLGISACYELIEWAAALVSGSSAEAFLGTQGDVWDAQADMLCAGIGAILALVTMSRLHDRELTRMR